MSGCTRLPRRPGLTGCDTEPTAQSTVVRVVGALHRQHVQSSCVTLTGGAAWHWTRVPQDVLNITPAAHKCPNVIVSAVNECLQTDKETARCAETKTLIVIVRQRFWRSQTVLRSGSESRVWFKASDSDWKSCDCAVWSGVRCQQEVNQWQNLDGNSEILLMWAAGCTWRPGVYRLIHGQQ